MGVSPLIVGLAGAGVVLVWSASHGANISHTVRDVLAGRVGTAPGTDPALQADNGDAAASPAAPATAPAGGNRGIGQLQAAGYGWTGAQWTALDNLWTRESDWNNTSTNPSSGAYGIAQFLDATWADVGGAKTSDPTLQIRYGLAYIKQRYGTPAAAWAHEQQVGWY